MKFMLFCMPSVQKIVTPSAIASGKRRSPAPSGFEMKAIRNPKAIGISAIRNCPMICQRARRS